MENYMVEEIWKDIPGFEGLYQASDLGRIKSFIEWNGTNVRILNCGRNNGYLVVVLSKNGIKKMYRVHRLILETFIGPCPKGMECRHLNGIRTDNRLCNLRWGTRSENSQDTIKHGNHYQPNNYGKQNCICKLNKKDIPNIREMIKNGYTCESIGKIYGVHRRTIQDIKLNKTWKHIK